MSCAAFVVDDQMLAASLRSLNEFPPAKRFARVGNVAHLGATPSQAQAPALLIAGILAEVRDNAHDATRFIGDHMPVWTVRRNGYGFERVHSLPSLNAGLALAAGARRAGAAQPTLAKAVRDAYPEFADAVTATDVARNFSFVGVVSRNAAEPVLYGGPNARILNVVEGGTVEVANVFTDAPRANDFLFYTVTGVERRAALSYTNAFGTPVAARTEGELETVLRVAGASSDERNAPTRNSAHALADASTSLAAPLAEDLDYMAERTLKAAAYEIEVDEHGRVVRAAVEPDAAGREAVVPDLVYEAFELGHVVPLGHAVEQPVFSTTLATRERALVDMTALAALPTVRVYMPHT